MVRLLIIGAVIAVAFILYALVDAAMSDATRARGVSKAIWVVLIVVLPVAGAVLWFAIGRGRGPAPVVRKAPDDDPRFTGMRMGGDELDNHMRDLEARLRELDEETFPGEQNRQQPNSKPSTAADGDESPTSENTPEQK